jgi:spore germination protein GerM
VKTVTQLSHTRVIIRLEMKRLLSLTALALGGGALAVALTACGSGKAVSLGKPTTAQTTTAQEQTGKVPTLLSLEVWFARDDGLVAVRRTHRPTRRVATAAIDALLAGPTAKEREAGLVSAVPGGTRLLGIGIRDGIATVDLTSEYQSGGGSHSMQLRLGQVVYTLTQFPTVQKVRFLLDGEPVNVFSSEGIVLEHPVGRSDYVNLLPAIEVSRPAADAEGDEPGDGRRYRERLRGKRDGRGPRRTEQGGRQDVHDRDLRHGLPRHLFRAGQLQGRA